MADKLTPQQEIAVNNRGGKLLVSAAAGSGKTKVLVDRLLSYLTDGSDPANLDEFLIITYTKAAASELRGKIAEKLTQRIAQEATDLSGRAARRGAVISSLSVARLPPLTGSMTITGTPRRVASS